MDAAALTLEQFVERYERPRRPVMLTGLCAGWRAAEQWTPERLLQRLGDCKFKVGGFGLSAWALCKHGRCRGKGAAVKRRRCCAGFAAVASEPSQGLHLFLRTPSSAAAACVPLLPLCTTLQVGSDDDGYAVRLKLKHFLAYCSHPEHAPADDSPL